MEWPGARPRPVSGTWRGFRCLIPWILIATVWLLGSSLEVFGAEESMGAVGWGRVKINHQTIPPFDAPEETHSGAEQIAAGSPDSLVSMGDGRVMTFSTDPRLNEGYTPFGFDKVDGVAALAASSASPEGEFPFLAALTTNGAVVDLSFGVTYPEQLRTGVVAITYQAGTLLAAMDDGRILSPNFGGEGVLVQITGGVKALAAGTGHVLALRTDGSVYAWGYDSKGRPQEFAIPVDAQTGIVAIAAGGESASRDHFLALRNDGRVVAFGGNAFGESTVPAAALEGVTAIAAGWSHSVALKADGTVVCWGGDEFWGQCSPPPWIQGRVRAISAGAHSTLALVRLEVPEITQQPASQTLRLGEPRKLHVGVAGYGLRYQWARDGVEIPGATQSDLLLSAGPAGNYSVVVSNGAGSVTSSPPARVVIDPPLPGTVVGWGRNDHGQIETPSSGYFGIVAVGAGPDYSVGMRMDGSLAYWGIDDPDILYAQRYAEMQGVTGIGAGYTGLMLLGEPGLILNDTMIYNSPDSAWPGAVAAAAGGAHALVLKRDGSVVIWGSGVAVTNSPPDVRSGVVAIAAGDRHSLALKSDGSVVAWGFNDRGQTNVPAPAQGQSVAIAAGLDHSLALRRDGGVVAWGDNRFGQSTVPVEASSGVIGIAAGASHSVALKADGTVVVWGDNSFGQRNVPLEIQGKVTGIAAGGDHTLAIIGTAALRCVREQGDLVLSWPDNLVGFHLQTSSSTEAGSWIDVPEAAALIGNRQTLRTPVGGEQRWYRLAR